MTEEIFRNAVKYNITVLIEQYMSAAISAPIGDPGAMKQMSDIYRAIKVLEEYVPESHSIFKETRSNYNENVVTYI